MEEDIKVLEEILNRQIEDTEGTKIMKQAIENLIKRNKELEEERQYEKELRIRYERRYNLAKENMEKNFIRKSRLEEILKQRLKKYQDADDGQYKQEYLTRGELELVDRYKECSELLKTLCEKDIYKIELNYIPKSKVREIIDTNFKNTKLNPNGYCFSFEGCQKVAKEMFKLVQEGDE